MEKIYLCLFGCFIISGLFGQQTNIGYTSSHGFSYRYLYPDNKSDADVDYTSSYIKDLNNLDIYHYSNQHVVSLERNITTKISASVGVGLQRKSVKLFFNLDNGEQFDPRHGFEYSNTFEDVDQLKIVHKDYYFVLPIHVRYNVIEKNKFQFYGSIGIKPHLYLNTINSTLGYSMDEKIVYRNKSKIKKEQNKLINPAFDAELGFDYSLSEQFSLRTNFLGDIDLFSNSNNKSSIDERWYTLYLSLGIVYIIN